MIIDFICRNRDIKVGTYRILVHDLANVLFKLGNDVQIHQSVSTTRKDAVLIYSKGDVSLYNPLDNRICGAISLSSDSNQKFDFSIVNSTEEKKSVEHLAKETVIINLVEAMYQDSELKNHQKKENIVLGYHGSYTHLSKLKYGFVEAFNYLIQKGVNIHLNCLTNNSQMSFEILREIGINKAHVSFSDWDFKTAKNYISQFDIGILPNLTSLTEETDLLKKIDNKTGMYNTDYIFRFKNKSNPGRSFVFNQLGIPVITDLTPSMMPMYFDEKCGSVATNAHTWLRAIDRFTDPQERNSASQIAHNRFIELYNMEKDALELISSIERIIHNKRNN